MMKKEGIKTETHTEILREAMTKRGMKQAELAELLGIKQPSLSGNFNRKRIGLDVFTKILDAMGYDVVIKDRESGEDLWKVR